MQHKTILQWLQENDPTKLETLWREADKVRAKFVGNAIHLRGLLEISSYCVRKCAYCGINATHKDIPRYRMTAEEILAGAQQAVQFGYGTVVIQSGEDYTLNTAWVSDIITKIKATTPLAITLSLGERPYTDLQAWKQAGADRYLLRFETSDKQLYDTIHPPLTKTDRDRFVILQELAALGYEVGSGIMVGIPGQSYTSLAEDIQLFTTLPLDMIGVGPYIPHPDTPLGSGELQFNIKEQVPNTELMTYKVLALTRILCPNLNLPSTTALSSINTLHGRELGLMRGANVVMPNLTPLKYRIQYEIYPQKSCVKENPEQFHKLLKQQITDLGRYIGTGPGRKSNLPLGELEH